MVLPEQGWGLRLGKQYPLVGDKYYRRLKDKIVQWYSPLHGKTQFLSIRDKNKEEADDMGETTVIPTESEKRIRE